MTVSDVVIDILLSPFPEEMFSTDYSLLYLLEGNISLTLPGRNVHMAADDILSVDPGSHYSVHSESDSHPLLCIVHIDPVFFSESGIALSMYCDSQKDANIGSYDKIRLILRELLKTKNLRDAYYRKLSCYYQLIDHLLTYHSLSDSGSATVDQMLQIHQYVERNYLDKISLNELSSVLHYSPAYLSRLIKKKLGMSFTEYVHSVRLSHVAEQLRNTKKQITHIAMDCGFMTTASLSKLFKKVYGCSPSEYRNSFNRPSEKSAEAEKRLQEHLGIIPVSQDSFSGTSETIHIDCSSTGKHISPIWSFAANVGLFADFCLKSHNRLIKIFQEIGIKHIRFSHVFDKRVVNFTSPEKNGITFVPDVLELIYEINQSGMAPFFRIESWSCMCQEAGSNPNLLSFSSFDEYLSALNQFIVYLGSFNFDSSLISEWQFELWEPFSTGLNDEYFLAFSMLQKSLKQHLPDALLGGCGILIGQNITSESMFVQKWKSSALIPDFFSVSYYPYTELGSKLKYNADFDALPKSLTRLKEALDNSGFSGRQIYITEWNSFYKTKSYFNDSLWKASYVIKCISESIGKAAVLIYDTFVDDNEKSSPSAPLRGLPGLLNDIMIEKPAFRVLRAMRHSGSNVLTNRPGCLVTFNSIQRINLYLYNFQPFNAFFYHVEDVSSFRPDGLAAYLEPTEPHAFHLEFHDIPNGVYLIEIYKITNARSSILSKWVNNGCFNYDSRIRGIPLILETGIEANLQTVNVNDMTLRLNYVLEPQEVYSINIKLR
ncbi:MAG: helix-turn-helix domain-containing protein [Parasporobacterium sp.]|nr:helix-turn-helix domain-containing protein [Parasporobacterium sp.]